MEIRDPIHNFIQLSEVEANIINTKVFQRLRGIKQLAMAYLVYPGALHNRFDHSLGVLHVASRMADKFKEKDELKRIIKLTALLHDIGHGPFSHVSEEVLEMYHTNNSEITEKIHETLTCKIIETNNEISHYLSESDRKKIVDLLSGSAVGKSLTRSIISGPLDADKQDYLLRDSYFCGVKYGVFDIERLIGTLITLTEEHDESLAAQDDGIHAIEQFVIAKYHMTTQVYRHRIRLITDSMIVRALQLGISVDQIDWLKNLYCYNDSKEYIENYLDWDDARLINEIIYKTNKESYVYKIFERLKERKLFKTIFTKTTREFKNDGVRFNIIGKLKEKIIRDEIEAKIAEFLNSEHNFNVDKNFIVLKTITIKSVREQSRDNEPEGSIMIQKQNGSKLSFENCSALFHSITGSEGKEEKIEVYAPCIDFKDDRKKGNIMKDIDKSIENIIESVLLTEQVSIEKDGDNNVSR